MLGRGDQERWRRLHRRVLTFALSWVIGAAKRCAGFDLVVSGASTPSFSDGLPSLVLARHGGPGDSFVLVHLLLTNYDADVRIVLKEVLQLDPALDVVLNRLGCCFVRAHAGETASCQVGALATSLGPGDTLLLFPEGANLDAGSVVGGHATTSRSTSTGDPSDGRTHGTRAAPPTRRRGCVSGCPTEDRRPGGRSCRSGSASECETSLGCASLHPANDGSHLEGQQPS